MEPTEKNGALRPPSRHLPPPAGSKPTEKSEGLDLEPALRRMHEWGLSDGDVGYEYWHQVAKLLKSATSLKARVAELEALLASTNHERPRRVRGSRR
jgi:hypothetical protein